MFSFRALGYTHLTVASRHLVFVVRCLSEDVSGLFSFTVAMVLRAEGM